MQQKDEFLQQQQSMSEDFKTNRYRKPYFLDSRNTLIYSKGIDYKAKLDTYINLDVSHKKGICLN